MSEKKEGYVYVLSNPVMPGLVKIGRSTRHPSDRVRELNSASGVALPFKLEASIRTKYPNWTERLLHRGGSGNLDSGDKWNFCLTSA